MNNMLIRGETEQAKARLDRSGFCVMNDFLSTEQVGILREVRMMASGFTISGDCMG